MQDLTLDPASKASLGRLFVTARDLLAAASPDVLDAATPFGPSPRSDVVSARLFLRLSGVRAPGAAAWWCCSCCYGSKAEILTKTCSTLLLPWAGSGCGGGVVVFSAGCCHVQSSVVGKHWESGEQ